MEAVDKIAEPKDPLVLTARKVQSLEPPIPIKASWRGKNSQQQEEKDLPADGEESFRSLDSSDEGGRSSFSGASHPPEPIDMDIVKTVYVAIDERSEPPVSLVRGVSMKGPFMDGLSIRVAGTKANLVVGAEGLAEERKVSGSAVASVATARHLRLPLCLRTPKRRSVSGMLHFLPVAMSALTVALTAWV